MKIQVTKDVANHQVNDDYQCILVQFDLEDKHFFRDRMNWMPKDEEVFKMFRILYYISPTFRTTVNEFMLEFKEVTK